MSRGRRQIIGLAVLLAICGLAAGLWWYLHPQPGLLRLHKATFADLKGWSESDPAQALAAFKDSCTTLTGRLPHEPLGGAGYAGTVGDWQSVCIAAKSVRPTQARLFFESRFAPVALTAGRVAEGRFTGYYEPQILASHNRHGRYRTPVYGKPDDLVSVDLGAFRQSLAGERIAGRVEGDRLVPYASRSEINAKGLAHARVLFYTDDPIELFLLHIQGSGRVLFDDGRLARVAYAAQNGQPYTAIGKILIARGVPREGMSLQVIRAWLQSHPNEATEVMNQDASYVFFDEQPLGDAARGAKGAQGVPLTPLASLAVDSRLHALGTPLFVAGPAPLGRLFIAQDIGGAIRGPVRGDVYFGFGKKAEANAGTMNAMGTLYALVPKAVAERLRTLP